MFEEKLVCYSPTINEILIVNLRGDQIFIECGDLPVRAVVKHLVSTNTGIDSLLKELSGNVLGEL